MLQGRTGQFGSMGQNREGETYIEERQASVENSVEKTHHMKVKSLVTIRKEIFFQTLTFDAN
ncbi:hypothetical protein E2562_035681 [Oryza meyeriana var. granulata]|uniref:Uncharacterized protein n=1 Tax=Oryza meyeriana var. granulata TaxID=110450 RepID=A0A6G1CVC7_9ORYZ|nr:hypothetical protein E2562_035681 [Oryza meyeriana var. granulata]